MKIKKLLSLGMAVVMTAALAVPAFATPNTPKNTTVITGAYTESTIDVVVPTTATAVINPYGLGVTATKSDDNKVQITGQIMTAPQFIGNKSNMDLVIGASVIGAIKEGSTMKLNATSTNGTPDKKETDEDYVAPATGKNAFVQLDVVQAPATVKGDPDEDAFGDAVITAYAAAATWTKAKSVVVGTKSATGEDLATVKAAKMDSDGDFASYEEGSVALFRLSGDCVTAPKTPWTADDSFTVTVAFTFAPAPAASN